MTLVEKIGAGMLDQLAALHLDSDMVPSNILRQWINACQPRSGDTKDFKHGRALSVLSYLYTHKIWWTPEIYRVIMSALPQELKVWIACMFEFHTGTSIPPDMVALINAIGRPEIKTDNKALALKQIIDTGAAMIDPDGYRSTLLEFEDALRAKIATMSRDSAAKARARAMERARAEGASVASGARAEGPSAGTTGSETARAPVYPEPPRFTTFSQIHARALHPELLTPAREDFEVLRPGGSPIHVPRAVMSAREVIERRERLLDIDPKMRLSPLDKNVARLATMGSGFSHLEAERRERQHSSVMYANLDILRADELDRAQGVARVRAYTNEVREQELMRLAQLAATSPVHTLGRRAGGLSPNAGASVTSANASFAGAANAGTAGFAGAATFAAAGPAAGGAARGRSARSPLSDSFAGSASPLAASASPLAASASASDRPQTADSPMTAAAEKILADRRMLAALRDAEWRERLAKLSKNK